MIRKIYSYCCHYPPLFHLCFIHISPYFISFSVVIDTYALLLSNFQVYTYDNYQGEEWYFIIYSYDHTATSWYWRGTYWDSSHTFTRTYFMKYKHPGASGNTVVATWTISTAGGAKVGTELMYPSVQINRGMIFYTYIILNAQTGVFQERVMGVFNYNNPTFPTGHTTFNNPTMFDLKDDEWMMKIAVGICK
ncbi:hypothetical protein MBAV_004396 [Candidatus Magnetobacterium bavaricum]|uniref:Uncharacterized protein n=1 Tax=Candidatus Magnetobacterium bavaricum TaxID=29290 RepID=A0A0F3GNA1_9BACT|nr:hypothetical protein MBAV_004396 [Candidatus Magnetobacterium bavaricum]